MNITARIIKLEKKMGKNRSSEELGNPIISLSPEEKVKWPREYPYSILGSMPAE